MWPLLIDMTLATLDMEMSDVFTYSNNDSDSAASAIVAACSNSATGSYLCTSTAGVTLTVPVVELYL